MSRNWQLYYYDIIQYGHKALAYAQQSSFDDLFANDMAVEAILWDIAVIGEAAKQIPASIKQQLPQIAWQDIVDMRNNVVHAYFGVSNNILWNVMKIHLPYLLAELEKFKCDNPGLFEK
ncbi:MAG: DUF86 domain-containing protein [Candidatus Symbiobacter sp.]|nr:DUF86 domain-containing protein [Candidatus Symbiobacter sp.]